MKWLVKFDHSLHATFPVQLSTLEKLGYKSEIKRKEVKRKTRNNWSSVFQIALKGGRGLKIWLWGILDIQFFCHAADNPQLIKTSMIYLYIKPEVKKKKWYNSNDYSYKWRLYWVITWKLVFGEGDFSDVGNGFLLLLGKILPPDIYRISHKR